MNKQDFELHFRSVIRVSFDWSEFAASDWPIELRYYSLPGDSDLIYTPWYARPDGSVCGYHSSSAMPQSVAEVAVNGALLSHHGVNVTAHPETLSVVPAYGLNQGRVLLLDGNHRAVSAQVAGSRAGIAAFVVNGPIDEHVLADLRHWI